MKNILQTSLRDVGGKERQYCAENHRHFLRLIYLSGFSFNISLPARLSIEQNLNNIYLAYSISRVGGTFSAIIIFFGFRISFLIIRYFPVSEIYTQTSGFLPPPPLHPPKMENPGTTRIYCSVYIFTVNLGQ